MEPKRSPATRNAIPIPISILFTFRKRSGAAKAMDKDLAMSLLGLGKGNRKKHVAITDYSEDDLLTAFRTECSLLGK